MKIRKLILLSCCFLLFLTGIRIVWLLTNNPADLPQAVDGTLDLRGIDLTDEVLQLNGEWLFYPWDLVESTDMEKPAKSIRIPDKWRNTLMDSAPSENPDILYGTYRLQILLDGEELREPFTLYFKDVRSAAQVFINGKRMKGHGKVATLKSGHTPSIKPFSLTINSRVKEIDLLIQVTDTGQSRLSGIKEPIRFGYASAVAKGQTISLLAQMLSISILILHFLFAIIIYIGFSKRKELLYLAVGLGSAALSILLDDDRILLILFPNLPPSIWTLLIYISYLTTVVFFMLFFKRLLMETLGYGKLLAISYKLTIVLYLLYIVLLLAGMRVYSGSLFSFLMLTLPILIAISLFLLVRRGTVGAIYLLFGAICIINSISWATLKSNNIVILPYYPFDIVIAVLCFAMFWFKQFFTATEESTALAKRLQLINDQKDEFLANTSHELRNPLHGIMSISQTIYESEQQLSMENRKNMETLIVVSKRMSFILNDLLDAQRLKEGGIKLQLTDVDLSAVLSGMMDMLRTMTKGKDITFKTVIPDLFPLVRADENRLFQVLFNLIHNAAKFTERGEVIVSAKVNGKMAVIQVKDTGIGMDDQTMRSIFQPYEQADSSMTAMSGGLGLGLSICDQLVRLHGGELTVESDVNEGSTFTVTIPLGKARSGPVTEHNPSYRTLIDQVELLADVVHENKPRILVVDDDPLNLSIIKQILQSSGFDAVVCTSGAEALDCLDKGKWDLVLSDVMMPRMSGYELTEKIRDRFTISELPILLLTARSQVEDIQTGFHFGANDYITKPVDKIELVARVKALIDLQKSLTERIAMEAAWLQAQIQPHFLFNTLNTIVALSDEDPKKMIKLINRFGDYLNASFTTQNLSELVPLENEMELVESYVYIQQERFGERLHIEWNTSVKSKVRVPPLVIQTLVENAITHGVLRKQQGGTVIITIEERAEDVVISIADNGIGMKQEMVQQLLVKADKKHQGIGLLNTDKRLKQLFGSGLSITSEPNVGTVVMFTVPL